MSRRVELGKNLFSINFTLYTVKRDARSAPENFDTLKPKSRGMLTLGGNDEDFKGVSTPYIINIIPKSNAHSVNSSTKIYKLN